MRNSTYMGCLVQSHSECGAVVARVLAWEGEMGSGYLVGIGFQSCKTINLWRSVTQQHKYASYCWTVHLEMITTTHLFIYLFLLSRAEPTACGGSQARGWIGATAASLHHSHSKRDLSCLCDLHHSSQQCQILNPLSEAEPISSWILVRFISIAPQRELPITLYWFQRILY